MTTKQNERAEFANELRTLAGEPFRFDGHNEIGVALLKAADMVAADGQAVAYWNLNEGFDHCILEKLNDAAKMGPVPLYLHPQPTAQPAGEPLTEAENDDAAVDRFAVSMKEKLARARDKGRGGWQEASQNVLTSMLLDHVEKGDPTDVANFCMFLWNLGHGIGKDQA